MNQQWTQKSLAAVIDHTILKPETTPDQVKTICEEAKQYQFASVCVNSCYIPLVVRELGNSSVKACSVVGFPLGAMASEAKAAETKWVVFRGAHEVDMVINVGLVKAGNREGLLNDIEAVIHAAGDATVKVILETCLLTRAEKIFGCEVAKAAGASFVKTSTGFGSGGATVEDVGLMREIVGPDMKIKASGGIRSLEKALAMLRAGADRLGASAGVSIIQEVPP